MKIISTIICLALVSVIGCSETQECPEGMPLSGGECRHDLPIMFNWNKPTPSQESIVVPRFKPPTSKDGIVLTYSFENVYDENGNKIGQNFFQTADLYDENGMVAMSVAVEDCKEKGMEECHRQAFKQLLEYQSDKERQIAEIRAELKEMGCAPEPPINFSHKRLVGINSTQHK